MLGRGVGESACEPFKSHSSVHHSPVGFIGASPVGLQSYVFGDLSQVLVLKAGVSDVGFEPLFLRDI